MYTDFPAERLHQHTRTTLVGTLACAVTDPATAVFEAGGKALLSGATRESAREILAGGVKKALREHAPQAASRALPGTAQATQQTARVLTVGAAARGLATLAGRAGFVGAVVDGGFAVGRGVLGVRNGEMTVPEVRTMVATEAGTGAVAGIAGVGLATAAVAVLGPLGAPVLFGLGALGSLGTKLALSAAFA